MLHRCTHASCQKQYHSNKRETNYITAQTNRVDVIMSQCLWWLHHCDIWERGRYKALVISWCPPWFYTTSSNLSVSVSSHQFSQHFVYLSVSKQGPQGACMNSDTLPQGTLSQWYLWLQAERKEKEKWGEKKYWGWKLETSEHYKPLLNPKGSRLHVAQHVDITERSDWGKEEECAKSCNMGIALFLWVWTPNRP